jgi:hypothetical protein
VYWGFQYSTELIVFDCGYYIRNPMGGSLRQIKREVGICVGQEGRPMDVCRVEGMRYNRLESRLMLMPSILVGPLWWIVGAYEKIEGSRSLQSLLEI